MTSPRSIITFLFGTFALSGLAFVGMLLIPAAQSPEGLPGLPVWLVAIWSPSLMAIIIAARSGALKSLLKRAVNVRAAGPALPVMLVPLLVLATFILVTGQRPDFSALPLPMLALLIGFNLMLGPLGEELGWRGLLLPALEIRLGWLGAALAVGVIWALWHTPLWLFESPQSQIPFAVFVAHVMLYSILMAAAHRLAPDTLVPAIALHTLFNSIVAMALMWDVADIAGFYALTIPLYGLAAILVAGLLRGAAGCPLPDPGTTGQARA